MKKEVKRNGQIIWKNAQYDIPANTKSNWYGIIETGNKSYILSADNMTRMEFKNLLNQKAKADGGQAGYFKAIK